jgi:hypothetical protein
MIMANRGGPPGPRAREIGIGAPRMDEAPTTGAYKPRGTCARLARQVGDY